MILTPYRGQDDVFIIDPTTPPQRRMDILYEDFILPDSRLPEVIALARRIIAAAIASGAATPDDPVSHLQAILDWQARNVRYQEDPTDADGWQLELFKKAMRAILDGEDDCDGKVTVVATLANAAGIPSIPAWIEQKSRLNHVAGLSCVPARFASRLKPPGEYDEMVVRPTRTPRCGGVWLWEEATLGDVRTPRGTVRGPIVGEHPYDVVGRFRAAGVMRLGL